MPQGVQAFAVLLLLLPGFLSARIVQMLCARPKQTELDKIVEALLFSFFTYLIFAVSSGTELPLSWSGKADQGGTHYTLLSGSSSLSTCIACWLRSLAGVGLGLDNQS